MTTSKDWHRIAVEAEQARDNALAQLRHEQANRRQWEADYRAEHAEHLLELEATIARVREVHEPLDAVHYQGRSQTLRKVCTGCGTDDGNWQVWPCPTIRAIERKP